MQPFIWAEKERYGIEIEETPGVSLNTSPSIEAIGLKPWANTKLPNLWGLICFSPKRSKSATKSPLPIAWHHSS